MIQANTTVLGTGAGYKSGNVLGTDISSDGSSMTLSTSGSSGYGISEVYMSGKVNFTGNLTYTGNTELSNTVTTVSNTTNISSYTSKGTQEITDASSSFPPTSNVINNGLVIFNRTTPLTISSDMEGTEDVLQVGADITLSGTNTHSGNTTIDLNKKLNIGSGSTIGSIAGNIVNYGTLTFDRSDASTHAGVISGSGSLVKSGAGTHTLTGLNTYAGATTINAGKLVLERDVPITSSTGFSGAGELVIQPSSASFTNALNYPLSGFTVSSTIGGLTIGKLGNTANLTVTNTTSASGPITFYCGTITINANVTANNNGDISLFGNSLTFGSNKTVTSSGQLIVAPQNTSNTIGLAGATGTLQLPLTYFTTHFTNGFSTIQIGSNTQTGNISSNALTLLDNMKVLTSGSLTLGGKPILGSNNLTLGSVISSFSGMPSHYFQTNGTGKVIRNLSNTSTLQFPIGNSSYNPVSITNNSGSADDFSVRVLDVIENNPNLSAIKHVNRTWDIGKTISNAGAGIDFTLNWNAGEIVNGPLANPILFHYGTYWETAIGSSTAAAGSPILSLTHTGYTGTFSPFAISDASTPLPVSMAFFNLNCAEDNVELNWQTASEHNSSHFVVERSLDGMEWEKLGEVASAGNSTSTLNYSFIDVSLLARTLSYYRLIQVDFDGESETYGPLSSNCEAINTFELVIAPNPSAGKFTLKVDTKRSQEMDVHIYHTDGKEVANEIISAAEGTSLHYLNMEDLASGIYTLYVQHIGGTISRKIVIL
jgi:autotransporter-associated beta strand protein